MNKKKKLILLAGVLCAAIISGVIIFMIKRTPNLNKLSNQQVLKYLTNKKIPNSQVVPLLNKMKNIPRKDIFQTIRTLPAKKQVVFRENMRTIGQTRFQEMLHHFFSLPLDQRNKFLDKQIAQMQQRMARFRAHIQTETGNQNGNQGRWRHRNFNPNVMLQHRVNMLANTTPEERAEMTAYFQALRQRMQQRGITPHFGR
jgi:hypothetical protein